MPLDVQALVQANKDKRAVHDPILIAVVQSVRQTMLDCVWEDFRPSEAEGIVAALGGVQDAYFVDRAYEAAEDVIEAALDAAYQKGAERMQEAATESVIEWKEGSNGVVATPTGSVTLQTWTATLDTVGVSVREVVPGRYCYELVPLVYRTAEEAKAAALEAATRGASPSPFRATHPVYIEKR